VSVLSVFTMSNLHIYGDRCKRIEALYNHCFSFKIFYLGQNSRCSLVFKTYHYIHTATLDALQRYPC